MNNKQIIIDELLKWDSREDVARIIATNLLKKLKPKLQNFSKSKQLAELIVKGLVDITNDAYTYIDGFPVADILDGYGGKSIEIYTKEIKKWKFLIYMLA